ncbi:MAG: hypothetical protein R2761_23220 [Acidimicrobiales bacterium]
MPWFDAGERIVAHGHGGGQRDRALVAVHGERVAERAPGQGPDPLDRGLPGAGDDEVGQGAEIVDGELGHHGHQALGGDVVGGGERVEVAHHLGGLPHVHPHDGHQGVVHLAPAEQVEDGDVEALLVHLAAVGGEAPAADVDHVAGVGHHRHRPAPHEHRGGHGDVVLVAGRQPRVVGDEHVARLHRVDGVGVEEVDHAGGQGVDVASGCR